MNLEQCKVYYEANKERFFADWKELLRFDSISNNPAHESVCRDCAGWVMRHLARMGFKSELIETPSKPLVYGEYHVPNAKRTVLFYGHYDVQPVDPLELWQSKPFAPEIRGDRMYARGAQDNKGQLSYVLKALEFLIGAKALQCNVKVIIEGEEETGSEGIEAVLPKLGERARGDLLLVCDSGTVAPGLATIEMGLRGVVACAITLSGPNKDLHSGLHGGIVRNPATEMARLIASLHNADGSIAIAGYYDGVTEPDPEDAKLAQLLPIDAANYERRTGVPPLGGETKIPFLLRSGFRPTIEINGIHSGYGGPGSKTIIPSMALAKITSRVVVGQDPDRCLRLIAEHLKAHTPKGVTLTITEERANGGAMRLSSKLPHVAQAREVLREVTGHDPFFHWDGASIPILAKLTKTTGAEPLLVGFGLEEDNMHAPNESFALGQFRDGFLYASLMLSRL